MKLLNVIVTGPAEAKKHTFIKTFSDQVVRSPEQVAIGKEGDTYSVEFGRSRVDGATYLYLAGTPMGAQFDFIWERLADHLLGFIVIFDAKSKEGLAETQELMARLKKLNDVPLIVFFDGLADRADPAIAELKKALGIRRDEQVFCGDAADKATIKGVLLKLLKLGVDVAKKVSV